MQRRFTLLSSDGQAHRIFPVEGLARELVTGAAHGASEFGILMTTALGTLMLGQEGQQSDPVGVRWISLRQGTVIDLDDRLALDAAELSVATKLECSAWVRIMQRGWRFG